MRLGDTYELDLIGNRCKIQVQDLYQNKVLSSSRLSEMVAGCILSQELLDQLLEHKALIDESKCLFCLPFLSPHVKIRELVWVFPVAWGILTWKYCIARGDFRALTRSQYPNRPEAISSSCSLFIV